MPPSEQDLREHYGPAEHCARCGVALWIPASWVAATATWRCAACSGTGIASATVASAAPDCTLSVSIEAP